MSTVQRCIASNKVWIHNGHKTIYHLNVTGNARQLNNKHEIAQ